MTTWHIYMSIESAERSTDANLETLFNGSAEEIRANLATMKARGMEVVPSRSCDKRDAKGYCLGHEENEENGGAA